MSRVRILKSSRKGSALIVALVILSFLALLLSSINFNTQIHYWLSRNDFYELISFYNAYSALILAESELKNILNLGGVLPEFWQKEEVLNEEKVVATIIANDTNLVLQGRGSKKNVHSLFEEMIEVTSSFGRFPLIFIKENISDSLMLNLNSAIDCCLISLPYESHSKMINFSGKCCFYIDSLNTESYTSEIFDLNNIEILGLIPENGSTCILDDLQIANLLPGEYNLEELTNLDIIYSYGDLKILVNEGSRDDLPSFHTGGEIEILSDRDVEIKGYLICNALTGSNVNLFFNQDQEFLDKLEQAEEYLLPKLLEDAHQKHFWIKKIHYLPEIVS